MNSNYGKSNPQKPSSVSLNNFNFDLDLGLGSNRPKSLHDQKNPNPLNSNSNSYSYSTTSYSSAQTKKPTWTHQPAPPPVGLPGAHPSMVGDIFGKSWGSTQPSSSGPSIGIVNKNPNLFGDLVSSVLDSKTSSSSSVNVPLKNATPTPNKSSFSMSNMANSLPKTSNTPPSAPTWGSSSTNFNMNNANKTPDLGGPSIKSVSGSGINSNNKDPFSSLSGFGSKQSVSLNSAAKPQKIDSEDDGFGDFQNAPKPSSTAFPSSAGVGIDVDFIGSTTSASKQTPVQASGGGDPMDMFFTSSSGGGGGAAAVASSEMDDWGMNSEFGGGSHDDGGTTTELEGLPPPPAGVSGSSAKGKGMDNYKQGQFADAIKWLSWAVILLEKAGDDAASAEVLSCRASCYKEVGEYKKAVADCTKVYFSILIITAYMVMFLVVQSRNISYVIKIDLLY